MNEHAIRSILAVVFIVAFAAACSGGGDGGGGPNVVRSGSAASALGTVSNFGSIFVNGVEYETDQAAFVIDGRPGLESDLRVGDVVLVRGRIDNIGAVGIADTVTFDDNVEGPIDAIDYAQSTFAVLGQTIIVGASTSFDDTIEPRAIDGLLVGDFVEVSGLVDANGTIRATRIELKPAGELEVTGIAAGNVTNSFLINALEVSHAGAARLGFPGGRNVQDGDVVEVRGTTFGPSGELIATRVELKRGLVASERDRGEVEGFVTRFSSAEDFDVAQMRVTTTGGTVFDGGAASDLAVNLEVEVEGEFNGDGVLVADAVHVRAAAAVRIEAEIDSVDAAAGRLVVLDIPIDANLLTRMEDKSSQPARALTLADLAAGQFVAIRGAESPAGSGRVRAARLERDELDDATLQGFVQSIAEPTFTVLGVTIDTTSTQAFLDVDDTPLDASAFFALLSEGALVKATGVESSTTVLAATEVEIEIAR